MARVLLIAPNWQNEANVASRRLHDLRRWLVESGHSCRVVGSEGDGPDLLVIEDPLRLRGELRGSDGQRHSRLHRWWRDLRHLPDPGILWAERVAASDRARAWAADSQLIISSSPPESTHLAALALAEAAPGALLWVDLQDGWIDDPLRMVLEEFPLRRWQEARVERRVLHRAATVSVTTHVWKRMLSARYPELSRRLLELQLAPPQISLPASRPQLRDGRLQLLHAGTFTLSHHKRRMELLLGPLLSAARRADSSRRAHVLLLGDLHPVESDQMPRWQRSFAESDWILEAAPTLPRERYFEMLAQQHGLLLLSASRGALPSKLFEYLQLGRPILALTPMQSAVWDEAERCEALRRVDYRDRDAVSGVLSFLDEAATREDVIAAPTRLGEAELRERFLGRLAELLGED